MAVVLSKGGTVSLTKEAGARGLSSVTIGLGWDAGSGSGPDWDLDASAVVIDQTRRVLSDEYFIFYNNLQSPDGSVQHSGDNRTGEGEGDDEQLTIELGALPLHAHAVVFVVSIDNAAALRQSFDQVRNAFIRVVNNEDQQELARFDLSDGAAGQTALAFGEVYRDGADWKFRAVGEGHMDGFVGILRHHGVGV